MRGIYAIRNSNNGRHYVGSASHIKARWKSHRSMLGLGKHHSPSLQRAWVKHGSEAFEFIVLELVVEGNLLEREQSWIDDLKASDARLGYNVAAVAGTRAGVPQPEAMKERFREERKGIPKSEETRRRMSEATKGRKKSEEHKQKLREATIRQFSDPEARLKMSALLSGRPAHNKGAKMSDAQREKLSEIAKRPDRISIAIANLPKVMTEEAKKRLREARAATRGTPRPKARSPSKDEVAEMVRLRKGGMAFRAIGDRLGRGASVVFNHIQKEAEMAKFKGPDGVTSVSVGGETFNVDADGCIVVPDTIEGAALSLAPLGFAGVSEEVIAKAKAKAKAKAADSSADVAADGVTDTPAA